MWRITVTTFCIGLPPLLMICSSPKADPMHRFPGAPEHTAVGPHAMLEYNPPIDQRLFEDAEL
jgi:hypothetical protein